MNYRTAWSDLKEQVEQLQITCEERYENAALPSEAFRWGAEASMAGLILDSMKDLEDKHES